MPLYDDLKTRPVRLEVDSMGAAHGMTPQEIRERRIEDTKRGILATMAGGAGVGGAWGAAPVLGAALPSEMAATGAALGAGGGAITGGTLGGLSIVPGLTSRAVANNPYSQIGRAADFLADKVYRTPESAGLFTPPGEGYEGLVRAEDIERVIAQKELEKEAERQRLLEQYRASGYDLDPNTRLRDLR